MTTLTERESADNKDAFVSGINILFPFAYEEFIDGIDDLIMKQDDTNEACVGVCSSVSTPVGDGSLFDLHDL